MKSRSLFNTFLCCSLAAAMTFANASPTLAAETDCIADTGSDLKLAQGTSYYDSVTDGDTADGYFIRKVSSASINASGKSAIQDVLNEAAENATDELPYRIVVQPGSYTLTGLSIGSNTSLYLDGVTFTQEKSSLLNMLMVGIDTGSETGYCYKNISVYGGTFDKNNNSGTTTVKVGHASNFKMENVTLQNTKNAHFMEVGGTDGFTLSGCSFLNQTITGSCTSYEAVQFDILVEGHIQGYSYEDLTNQNIVIDGCTFDNVRRGVGSHNAVLNNPMTHIQITDNTFTNLGSAAIQFMYCEDCTISGNTIDNCPRGIAIYSVRADGTYLSSTISSDSSTPTTYVAPPTDQQIVITDNRISCSGTDTESSYLTSCILINGLIQTKAQKGTDGDTLPKGDYYISGVTISGNTLTTTANAIQLYNSKNGAIESNTISCSGTTTTYIHAISIDTCSTDNRVCKNTIKKSLGNGINISSSSSVSEISGNTINSPKYCGIYVADATATVIDSNVISKSKNCGIVLLTGANVQKITGNKITSSGAIGLNIADIKSNMTISQNTVSKCETAQIYVNVTSTKKSLTITDNTVTGKSDAQGIWFQTGKGTISGNKVTSCYYSILVSQDTLVTIQPNKCTKNTFNQASISGTETYASLAKPSSIKAVSATKNSIRLKWSKVSKAKGYVIYRSTSKNGTYKQVATVSSSKTSYTDKKLKKNKKYYYKIAAYQTSNNGNALIAGTESKTISKKTKK